MAGQQQFHHIAPAIFDGEIQRMHTRDNGTPGAAAFLDVGLRVRPVVEQKFYTGVRMSALETLACSKVSVLARGFGCVAFGIVVRARLSLWSTSVLATAKSRGEMPMCVVALTSALLLRSNFAKSGWLYRTAKCSGVNPCFVPRVDRRLVEREE